VIARLVLAALLLGHALIHLAFIAPTPPATAGGPQWPFDLRNSWILETLGVRAGMGRLLGMAMIAVTLGGFALAAIAAIGVGPAGLWPVAAGVGTLASLGVLLLFFRPWLVLGVGIDLVLLWVVLVVGWSPDGIDSSFA
jgi:hypothetical protein